MAKDLVWGPPTIKPMLKHGPKGAKTQVTAFSEITEVGEASTLWTQVEVQGKEKETRFDALEKTNETSK